MTHALKTDSQYFEAVVTGAKTFELRKDDRPFAAGDKLLLQEVDDKKLYTGRELELEITFVLRKHKGIFAGYCIIAFKPVLRPQPNFDTDWRGDKDADINISLNPPSILDDGIVYKATPRAVAVQEEWPGTYETDTKDDIEVIGGVLNFGAGAEEAWPGEETQQQPPPPPDLTPAPITTEQPAAIETAVPSTQEVPTSDMAAVGVTEPAQAANPDDDFPF